MPLTAFQRQLLADLAASPTDDRYLAGGAAMPAVGSGLTLGEEWRMVGEARRAFRRFRTMCFWSYRSDLVIGAGDVPWVAEQLMKCGNREAWRVGVRLCR